LADAIGAVADNVSQQLVYDPTSAASSLSEGLRQGSGDRVEPSGSFARKTVDNKLDRVFKEHRPSMGMDRGVEERRPSVDRGFEERRPGMDQGVEERRPSVDRGFEERRPGMDQGVDERRPSMDRGVEVRRPSLDQGVEERRPSVDRRVEERRPSMDRRFEERPPSMDRGVKERRRSVDRGVEDRRPSMDRGAEYIGQEPILGLKAAAGDKIMEDRPSLVAEPANVDVGDTVNHNIALLLQPSTTRSDYTSYKDDFTAMSDNHAIHSITISRLVEHFSIVFVHLLRFLSGRPGSTVLN